MQAQPNSKPVWECPNPYAGVRRCYFSRNSRRRTLKRGRLRITILNLSLPFFFPSFSQRATGKTKRGSYKQCAFEQTPCCVAAGVWLAVMGTVVKTRYSCDYDHVSTATRRRVGSHFFDLSPENRSVF